MDKMGATSRVICASRAAWYGATEGKRLRLARRGAEPHRPSTDGFWHELPLITCYVPTYNRLELLYQRAMPSIQRQTHTNLEIIVAAHGCTDGTQAAVRGDPDPRVRLIEVPRKQTYKPTAENHWFASEVAPANAALKAARGDYIARLDDDDEWDARHIERLLDFAQRGNYEFVSGAYETHERTVHHDSGFPPIGGIQTWVFRSYLRFMKFNPACWRKKWDRVNDVDLATRFRLAGVRIGHLDIVTATVLPRPGEKYIGLKAYLDDAAATEERLKFRSGDDPQTSSGNLAL